MWRSLFCRFASVLIISAIANNTNAPEGITHNVNSNVIVNEKNNIEKNALKKDVTEKNDAKSSTEKIVTEKNDEKIVVKNNTSTQDEQVQKKINDIQQQINDIVIMLTSSSITNTVTESKISLASVPKDLKLDKIWSAFTKKYTLMKFPDLRKYFIGLNKTYHVILNNTTAQKIVYKTIINCILLMIVSLVCSLLLVNVLSIFGMNISIYGKKCGFYVCSIILAESIAQWTIATIALYPLFRLICICPLVILFIANLPKWYYSFNVKSMSIVQRITIISSGFFVCLCNVLSIIIAGYYWGKLSYVDAFTGCIHLCLIYFNILFVIYIWKVKRYVNHLIPQSKMISAIKSSIGRSLVGNILSVWHIIVLIAMNVISIMFIADITRTGVIFRILLSILCIFVILTTQRIARFRFISKNRYILTGLLQMYKNVKRHIKIIAILCTIFSITMIWNIELIDNLAYFFTPALTYLVLSLIKLWLFLSFSLLLLDYWSFYNVTKIRESVRNLALIFIRSLLCVIGFLYMISILGMNTTWIGASMSFLSVGLAFGVRDTLNDLMSGALLIIDSSFSLGDVVVIDGVEGIIEDLSLVTMKIRLENGVLVSYRYGFIQKLGSKSKNYSYSIINMTIYDECDPDLAVEIMKKSYQQAKESKLGDRILTPIEIKGIDQIGQGTITIQARIKVVSKSEVTITRLMNLYIKKLCGTDVRLVDSTKLNHVV